MLSYTTAYIVSKTTKTVDKTLLKKWIEAGNTIEGTYIEERKNLQIK